MIKAIRHYGIFLLIPCVIALYSFLLRAAGGPFWLATNFDPSYIYLANGLHLLKGAIPNNADHPGIPLMLLCAVVCWVFNIGQSVTDVATHVFIDPEFYLHIVFVLLTLFSLATSVALAMYVFRKTNDTIAAVLSQLPALSFLVLKSWETFEPVQPIAACINSEPLLISVVNLFNICLLMSFFAKTPKDRFISTLLWGFVCGCGVAEKLSFIPLLIIPLIVLSWKDKIFFAGMFIASFVIWTLPIISKYPYILKWIILLSTHTGHYGAGSEGFIDISSYLLNWKGMVIDQGIFVMLMLLAFAIVFWKVSIKKWDRGTFFLLVVALGVLIQFGIVAKHAGARYLMPGIGLCSSLLVLFYLQGFSWTALGRRAAIIFIAVIVLLGTWKATEYRADEAGLTKDILTFYHHIHDKYQGYTFLRYYRSSGQDAALEFGDGWNGEFQFKDELFHVYPNSYFFDLWWNNRIVSFKDRVLSNDLLDRSSGIIFQADDSYDLQSFLADSAFTARLLEKGRFESIYLLTRTTEKQAILSLMAADHFAQTGDFARALIFARQAQAFHFQPKADVDTFIRFITPYVNHST